jgi:thiol-disulfide isomerase/thioredoxin
VLVDATTTASANPRRTPTVTATARLVAPLALIGSLALGLEFASRPLPASADDAPPEAVTLVPVKYDAFLARIAANKKAKLTVVDAWATWCGPCKENFPHLVEMHRKYADKGLAAVSLSLDDYDKPKKVAEATAFLVEKKATFPNYILEETPDDAFEKLDLTAIPAVFLYGPGGKLIKRFTLEDVNNLFTYEQVEEAVKAYLDGKPIPADPAKK